MTRNRQNTDTDSFFRSMNEWATGSFSIMPFIVAVCILLIGIAFFAEDTKSSMVGVQMFEQRYDLNMATWEFTRWGVSLLPQVAQMFFFYIYLSDRRNKFALWAAIAFMVVDLFLDGIYRGKGYIGGNERLGAISVNTMIYSLLSEVLISMSIGYILVMARPVWARVSSEFGLNRSGNVHRGRNRNNRSSGGSQQNTPVEQDEIADLFRQRQ